MGPGVTRGPLRDLQISLQWGKRFRSEVTLSRENPVSNHLAAVSKLLQFCSHRIVTVHSVLSTWLQTEVDL